MERNEIMCINRIIEWIKWDEWIRIIKKVSKWTKLSWGWIKQIWNRFIRWTKRIWNKFQKLIGWIIFPLAVLALILTLTMACINFFHVNEKILEITEKIEENIPTVSKCKIMESLQKMKDLRRNVFDSNAITFLVSFVLVFLGSIWLNIEGRAKKLIKEAEKTTKKLAVERSTMSLHSQILALQVLSINCQCAMDSNRDVILLCYRTHRMAGKILEDFHSDKYIHITKEGKRTIDEIFTNMINDFHTGTTDDETFEDTPRPFKNSIDTTVNKLKELQKEISRIREV